MRALSSAAILALLCVATATAAESDNATVEIPLKDIWAIRSPDTRDIRAIDEKAQPLVEEIKAALRRDTTGPGFVVAGTGLEALKAAHAVLTGEKWKEPNDRLPAGELTLIFYARRSARYVWINNVRRDNRTIVIKYEAVTHESTDTAKQIALIPLGTLPVGKYEVKFVELPTITPGGIAAEKIPEIVCKPFSFEVLPAGR